MNLNNQFRAGLIKPLSSPAAIKAIKILPF